jgi:hypothetical protein
MKNIIGAITIVVLSGVYAVAQIDTLTLSQISSIEFTEGVKECYVENVLGDSVKELIVRGSHRITAYNPFNGQELWTSPDLINIQDLAFRDMNGDGDLDIIVLDTTRAIVFDPNHSLTLWSHPLLPFKRGCIAAGDLRANGNRDIVIARSQAFSSDSAQETVWVEIFLGPDLHEINGLNFPIYGNGARQSYDYREETIIKMSIEEISGAGLPSPRILIFNNFAFSDFTDDMGFRWYNTGTYGGIRIIDPANFGIANINGIGRMISYSINQNGDSTLLYVVTDRYEEAWGDLPPTYWHTQKSLWCLSNTGFVESHEIWRYYSPQRYDVHDWRGPAVGDIDLNSEGNELCYSIDDTLVLVSYPSLAAVWRNNMTSSLSGSIQILHLASLFERPQILSTSPMKLFDGLTGNLSAIFIDPVIPFNKVVDFDQDNEDELLWYAGDNIVLFHAVPYPITGIKNPDYLPNTFHLCTNYPNPFNAQTTISYSIPKAGQVNLTIYNILGQKVTTLIDGVQQAGEHRVVWDASDATSGIYFYTMRTSEITKARSCLLLK